MTTSASFVAPAAVGRPRSNSHAIRKDGTLLAGRSSPAGPLPDPRTAWPNVLVVARGHTYPQARVRLLEQIASPWSVRCLPFAPRDQQPADLGDAQPPVVASSS